MGRASLALLAVVACGRESGTAVADGSDAGATFAPSADASNLVECADRTKDPFVISEGYVLYSFHPTTLAFDEVGRIACNAGDAKPTSMAVDRRGTAWVRHSDGSIWKVSTRDLTCTATTYVTLGPSYDFYQFGMGFSTDGTSGSSESLFLSDSNGAGLARFDFPSMRVSPVGPYTGALAGKGAELTGTADGRLYGFFVTIPAQLAEISKANGAIISAKELTNLVAGDAWAFSFHGGDFWFYTHDKPDGGTDDGGSDVTRYRPSDATITLVKPKVGFKIVGAGVSTCAPTQAVR